MSNGIAAEARETALRLTSWPSVTGTKDEADFAEKLAASLTGFDRVWTEAIAGDGLARRNVFALKRGTGRRTIVLTGHFDVVPIEDYGALKPFAYDPARLLPELVARLRRTGENPLALADLENGAFLPGRGLLDMKAGLAAGLAAIAGYHGAGNLLFVAVADEEDRSAGMRAAAPRFAEIAADRSLDIQLVINLDAISDQGDGTAGRVAALGSIGKQLLTALVVGQETHACFPADGANAAYLAAELLTEFELAPELAETSGGEIAAPPTALSAKDLKSGYNVTTPAQVWVYWNTLQHRRTADGVLDIASTLARRAMARAAQKLGRVIQVMTYAELAAHVGRDSIAAKARELAGCAELDLPERSKLLTLFAWERSGLTGPAVILGFGSIPYAAVSLGDERLERIVRATIEKSGLGIVQYFPGISDMSFVGGGGSVNSGKNTPLAGTSFDVPRPAGFPCINIGPWGRDYHQVLERLHAPYAFETLPKVLLAVIEAVLESG